MKHDAKIVQDTLNARLDSIRAIAADNKAEQAAVTAIQGWKAMPATITDAQIAMIVVVAQSNPAAINPNVLQAVGEKLNEMDTKDKNRLSAIMQAAEDFSRKPRLQPGISMEVMTAPVAKDSTKHAVIVALLEIDHDLNVSVPESLGVDLCMGVYVTPRVGKGLTESFNQPMQFTKAGAKLTPMVVTYDAVEPGVKHIHISGYTAHEGQVQPVSMVVPVELPEQKPAAAPKAPQP